MHKPDVGLPRVAIVGAGAIGSLIGASLSLSGCAQVSVLARGANLAALQTHGWRMDRDSNTLSAPVAASDDAHALGVQDLVVVAVKGPALGAVAASMQPLLGPDTIVLPAMNGVPWWFCHGLAGFEAPLRSVDPTGAIAQNIPLRQVLACVVHASSALREPGWVSQGKGRHVVIGEPGGGCTPRAAWVGELLQSAGFEVTVSPQVRQDIWFKLWGNATMNPVSALTGATVDEVLGDSLVRAFCSTAMREIAQVGASIGCPITHDVEERHRVTAQLGRFKTSMLQDVEAGRPIELDALVGAVRDIAVQQSIPVPSIDALLGLCRLQARMKGLYPHAPHA